MIPNRKFGPPGIVVSGVREVRLHGMRREYFSISFPFPLSLLPSLPLSILPSGIWQDQVHILLSLGERTHRCLLPGWVCYLHDTLKSPFPFQLFISRQSAWMGHITLVCPCGWMLKSLFLSWGFYGWLASSVINQGGLRFSTEVRQNHSQKKLEWVYFLF